MTKKLILGNVLLGFLSWVIPFVASFLFYKPGGELAVPYATFKSAIMVMGTLSGCYLLVRYFRLVETNFVRNGIVVGISWLAINLLLDALVLVPMMKTSLGEYFLSIGMSYLSIPVISVAMGYLLDKNCRQ